MALEKALELNANLCALIKSLGGEAFEIKLINGHIQLQEAEKPVKSEQKPVKNETVLHPWSTLKVKIIEK